MPNYWLGIMAAAFAVALTAWIALVFMADRQRPRQPQESMPHREVIGGEFEAREGGRQLMPHPGDPSAPPGEPTVPQQRRTGDFDAAIRGDRAHQQKSAS